MDTNNKCTYEKPTNVNMDQYDCFSHESWDFNWISKDTCTGRYLWRNEIEDYIWMPTPGCYTCSGKIHGPFYESVRDTKTVKDVKVLCNSGDYLSLLSKTAGSDDRYNLIFRTTYPIDFDKGIPNKDGKYCTALWEVVRLLRKDLQQDGVYDSLPSACDGPIVLGSSSSAVAPRIAVHMAMAMAFVLMYYVL